MKYNFTLDYWKDKKWYVGRLREVPGVFSQGRTLTELKENIQDAYSLMIEESNSSVPLSSVKSTAVGIVV
ncbi:MAG: type II toxin-antitoxin system HicB family antitoxin [Bacteroidota bacterium]|nr:type II toxin-antitoxin system HicB family antitoxin [Bacteroidota bacterium]